MKTAAHDKPTLVLEGTVYPHRHPPARPSTTGLGLTGVEPPTGALGLRFPIGLTTGGTCGTDAGRQHIPQIVLP